MTCEVLWSGRGYVRTFKHVKCCGLVEVMYGRLKKLAAPVVHWKIIVIYSDFIPPLVSRFLSVLTVVVTGFSKTSVRIY